MKGKKEKGREKGQGNEGEETKGLGNRTRYERERGGSRG